MSSHDWHVLCVPPIDVFEGMTPLTNYLFPAAPGRSFTSPHEADYLIDKSKERLDWVSGALDALHRASSEVNWEGDFRHEPYVGALPWAHGEVQYLVVKQENNGTCFIISKGFAVPLPSHETVFSSAIVSERAGRPVEPTSGL